MKIKATECVNNGRKVWRVNIPASFAGKRHRVFGETKEQALEAAQLWLGERKEFGSRLADVTVQERALVSRYRNLLSIEAIEQALKAAASAAGSKPVQEAWDAYLLEQSRYSKEYLQPLKTRGRRICAYWEGKTLADVSGESVFTFVRAQGNSEPDYYKVLRQFFNWCTLKQWIASNPVLHFKPRLPDPKEKEIFTTAQLRRLLALLLSSPVAPQGAHPVPKGTVPSEEMRSCMLRYVVVGAFAGLRTSEIQKLRGESVKEEIYVGNLKTQRRGMRSRYVDILPVLQAWFKFLRIPKNGKLIDASEANFQKHRRALSRLAGRSSWPDNILRNSFASYHLKAFEDPGKTATMLGHTDAETTAAKYRVAVSKAEALKYFEVMPDSV